MGGVEGVEEVLQVRDDGLDGEVGNRLGVGPQGFNLDLEARVSGCVDGEALRLIARLPMLPGAGCDPKAVDEDDGVGTVGHGRAFRGFWVVRG